MSKLKTAHLWQNAVLRASQTLKDTNCNTMLKHRTSFQNIALAAVDNKRDRELKTRTDELEDLRIKYKTENEEKTKLQEKLEGLESSQSVHTRRLQSSIETNERLNVEVKRKTEELEKMQRNVNILEDRVRNLEIKASEVEKAELTLESTRKLLDSSQTECRGRESEIRRITTKSDETEKQLEYETSKNKVLERKMEDLKQQVRQELIKNESIERGLDTIPRLEDEVGRQRQQLEETERDLNNKTALLTASKQSIRDYIDKIREAEERVTESETLKESLATAQYEIQTLKHLMKGKDAVMFQKLQAIEQVKCVLSSKVRNGETNVEMNKLKASIDKLSKIIRSEHSHEGKDNNKSASFRSFFITNGQVNNIDVNKKPFSLDSKNSKSQIRSQQQDFRRPVTAVVYPNIRPNTSIGSATRNRTFFTSEFSTSGILSDRNLFSRQNSYDRSPRQSRLVQDSSFVSTCSASVDSEEESCRYGSAAKLESKARVYHSKEDTNNLSAKNRDDILTEFIILGDRVRITIEPKPPRYGRKKLKNINYSGIVKYKGYLDKPQHDARLMVGLKLDETMGDTEGCVNGKSFMFTPANQGKFFKIRDVSSVFDKKTGSYISTEILVIQHANKHRSTVAFEESHNDSDSSHS